MDNEHTDAIYSDNCGCEMPPTAFISAQLRHMMETAEGADKCTLCKAVEALEKPQSSGWGSSSLLMLIMMLFMGMDSGNPQTSSVMQAYLEALQKAKENPEPSTTTE